MNLLRRTLGVVLAIVAAFLIYLFFWPVPIDPVAWEAPVDAGLVDPFEPNDRLRKARLIDLGSHQGPEDVAEGSDGLIYTTTNGGQVIRFDATGNNIEVFAETGGRPLGLEFDSDGSLLVANAYLGLQRITPDGTVEVLTDEYNGEPILYADDVAVANNGMVYFSDASSKFGAMKTGGSYEASLMDLMEHGGHGRIYRYDPTTRETSIILDGLNFANGVAISDDQQYLMINETGSYRVLRHWLEGPDAGNTEIVIDNLPGFPDNINNGLNGRFWVGLVAPRNKLLDDMSGKPWLRKLVQRLPASVRPKAVPSSHVIAINADGEVLMNLQDTSARMPALTGVCESNNTLWLSSLFGNRVGKLDKRDLANQ
jgi:sugar lactone lactonase YvrE